jgi:hypothetical protein
MLYPFDHTLPQVAVPETTSGDATAVLPPRAVAEFVRPQFRIRDLFVATTAFAIFFALAQAIGIGSLLIAYIAYLICVVVIRTAPEWRTTGVQLTLDLMAGALLPIGCIVFDPFVFHEPTLRVVGLVTIGSQIAMLCTWMFVAPLFGPWAFSFAGGFMRFGCGVAALIGFLLFPLSIVTTIALIGLLGFIPFATATTYYRHSVKASECGLRRDRAFLLGLFIAVLVPIVAWMLADFVPRAWLHPAMGGFLDGLDP